MRFTPLFLWMLGMFALSFVQGQATSYLWVNGEQVWLTQDPTRLSVILDQEQPTAEVWQSSRAAKQVHITLDPEIAEDSHAEWLLFEIPASANKTAVEAADWQQTLGLTGVKSISYGYLTPEATPLWFDHQVSYRPGPHFDQDAFDALLAEYPGAYATQTYSGIPYVEVSKIEHAIPLANALYEGGLVVYAQPAFRSPTTLNSPLQMNAPQCSPADPHFSDQFYLENTVTTPFPTSTYPYFAPSLAGTDINVLPAWCITTGNSGVVVAVVDEGLEAHEDLEDGLGNSRVIDGYYTNPANIGNGEPTQSGDAHGQAVAGIVAASHNNVGPSGIAPEASLLAVHIDKAASTDLQRADGIEWAYKNGADIILNAWTYSFCTGFSSQALEDVIDSAQTYGRGGLGSLVIFAAGFIFNDGDPTCVQYPANLAQVLTVGAIRPDADTNPPDYAPYGAELDMVSVSAYSRAATFLSVIDRMGTLGYNDNTTNGPDFYADKNYFRYFGGTSSAAAMVAGTAALMLDVNSSLSHTQLADILTSTTVDVGPAGTDTRFGSGMLDAHAAVMSAQATFPVEWGDFEGEQVRESIELSWQTFSEVNNHRFEVQRQENGVFVAIGEVAGQGTTSELTAYRFVDQHPQAGTNLYRLKQVDFDGTEELGRTLVVNFTSQRVQLVGPYPNPARDWAQITLMGQQGRTLSYRLLDVRGQLIANERWEVQQEQEVLDLPIAGLSPGIYMLEIRHLTGILAQRRLIVQP